MSEIADGSLPIPRFFLHQATHDGPLKDPDGTELPDLAAAQVEALAGARHLWAAAILQGKDLNGEYFEIADETGCVLLVVPLAEALPPGLRRKDNVT